MKFVVILISFPVNSDKRAEQDNKSRVTLFRKRKDLIHMYLSGVCDAAKEYMDKTIAL